VVELAGSPGLAVCPLKTFTATRSPLPALAP
jgi:hypothetical protein